MLAPLMVLEVGGRVVRAAAAVGIPRVGALVARIDARGVGGACTGRHACAVSERRRLRPETVHDWCGVAVDSAAGDILHTAAQTGHQCQHATEVDADTAAHRRANHLGWRGAPQPLMRRWRRRSVSPSPPAVAGSEARPSPQSAALAATLGAARRRPPWPAPASVALACMAPAATLGAATLPSLPAAVARDDARHARDRGTGGDARRWELTVALPGLRPQRRWRGEPATFGVALPACSGGGDARPSPRLRRWRQRSTHQLAVALPVARARSGGAGGDARRSSPSLSLARTRSGGAGAATLGVALPAWEQRRRRRLAQPAAAALAAMCRRR